MEVESAVMRTPIQPLALLVIAIAVNGLVKRGLVVCIPSCAKTRPF